MQYKRTTHIPNILFDELLTTITGSELKILLVILRKTNGWIDLKTGKRKTRERISHKQFMVLTGMSRSSVIRSIQSLLTQNLIKTTDYADKELIGDERQGNWCIYYTSLLQPVSKESTTCSKSVTEPVSKVIPIKTNPIKLKEEKLREWRNIQKIKEEIRKQFEV